MTSGDRKKGLLTRIITIISGLGFIGFTVFTFVQLIQSSPPVTNPGESLGAREQMLEEQAKGYEAVLAREPDNTTALQGLVEVHLELGDLEEAIPPLEKLISLYPEEENLQLLLTTLQEKIANPPEGGEPELVDPE